MEWISVKDRLPESLVNVTVKLIDGSEWIAFKSRWFDGYIADSEQHNRIFSIDVTHWKPIEITNK